MSIALRKIDVDGLRVGMYVSQLDRPWLETPFLFQGFYIRSAKEIAELRRYCKFVEIDIEESDPGIAETMSTQILSPQEIRKRSTRSRRDSMWRRFARMFGSRQKPVAAQPKPGEFYQDTASTADELVVAKNVHTGAVDKLMSVLGHIRSGGSISMPELEVVTGAMVDSVLRNSTAMALLVRMQQVDEYTASHSLETSVWALVFGRHLGLDREALRAVGLGGLLLDVGRTKMPAELLNKKGPLTDAERAYLRTHVEHGLEILREASDVDRRVLDMVATHHERYDGSGYPRGWKGNQIPVFGRIGGIVDS
jgi:putative nucleotidyltransferase with HDIG domain